jgi:UDP-GlcNAc:undecaprenyl-phosphate/decaprenyl-phosphate GlcNAc-1-phosphate transferase
VSREAALFVEVGVGLLAASFALSVAACALVRRWAGKLGFLDRPGGHKAHAAPIPLGGGLAIWLTAVAFPLLGVAIAFFGQSILPAGLAEYASGMRDQSGKLLLILGLATLIMLMGLFDDRKALSWRLRLATQVGLAAIFAQFGVEITLFGLSPLAGKIVTVLWVVGLTNAFNFLDNMDGLAAGVGLIAATMFAGAQVQAGSLFVPAVLLGLVGALAGFLVHNRHPARLFMGDAGSNFLGFLLGTLTVAGTYFRYGKGESPWGVLAPLLVMAVPLYDTTSVVLIRLREGRSPFLGDRRHFSHRLVERGLTSRQAVRTIYLVTLSAGLGSLLLHRLDSWGALVVVSQTLCLLGIVAILEMSASRSDRTN